MDASNQDMKRIPRWALAPVLILGFLLSIQAVLVTLAVNDPSFAVEDEYYKKAINWDQDQQQQALNSRLGYRVSVTVLPSVDGPQFRVLALDSQDRPLEQASVDVVAFPNARSAQRQRHKGVELASGQYSLPTRVTRSGLWELRITLVHEGETFTTTQRVDVPTQLARHRPAAPKSRGEP